VGNSLILAAGLVILANGHPCEGFVFRLPVALAMLAWMVGRDRPPLRESLARVVLPIFVVLLVGGLATGFYYYRVTGSPFVGAAGEDARPFDFAQGGLPAAGRAALPSVM